MTRIHLATGIARREDCVLLVASRYASHAQPLWNLPGGRQRNNELLNETVKREFFEELHLDARMLALAYVSESYDGERHFTNVTFEVEISGTLALPTDGDHIAAAQWVAVNDLGKFLHANVVREPLLAYLDDRIPQYHGFHAADITVIW